MYMVPEKVQNGMHDVVCDNNNTADDVEMKRNYYMYNDIHSFVHVVGRTPLNYDHKLIH